MSNSLSRRKFVRDPGAAAAALPDRLALLQGNLHSAHSLANAAPDSPAVSDRIVDIHVHFDENNPNFINDFLRVSEKLNLTACMLTLFASRPVVLDAAKQRPTRIVPFDFVDLARNTRGTDEGLVRKFSVGGPVLRSGA